MANWILVPCLAKLRDEVNAIAPNRDKASDGTIGDAAHQAETSDHNDDEVGRVPIRDADSSHEVHAWDADSDLRESDLTMERIVQHIVARCRSGAEKRLRYVIYNRRIWKASTGWAQQAYTGPSAHTEHAHFSASYITSLEASTASWHLEDIPVALTAGDKTWLTNMVDARADAIETSLLAKLPAAVGALPVDVAPGRVKADGKTPWPSMQPWARVDAYGSPERGRIFAAVEDVKGELTDLAAEITGE